MARRTRENIMLRCKHHKHGVIWRMYSGSIKISSGMYAVARAESSSYRQRAARS